MSSKIGLAETSDALAHLEAWEIRREQQLYRLPPIPPNAEKYTIHSFMWSDTEYTPRELLDNFQHLTPFLVISSQGYLGRDECTNTVASDEVYWVKGIVKVHRVVLKNEDNAYFSIPIDNKVKVQPYKDGKPAGQQTSLKQFCEELKDMFDEFKFTEEGRHYVYQGAGAGDSVRLGVLQVVDHYDERHMMVNSLCSGRIHHESCVIPIYMPITFCVAVARETNDHKHFYRTMLDMYHYVNEVPKTIAFPKYISDCNEIMVYKQKPKEGQYDYLSLVTVKPSDRQDTTNNLYTPISAGYSAPVLPNRKKRQSKQIIQTTTAPDKSRYPTPPPGTEPLDQRGGARGPGSCIYIMSQQGYNVVDVHVVDALTELVEVLDTGKIPEMSKVSMDVISVYVDEVTPPSPPSPPSSPSPPRPSSPGPPITPRDPFRSGLNITGMTSPPLPPPRNDKTTDMHAALLTAINKRRASLDETNATPRNKVQPNGAQSFVNPDYHAVHRSQEIPTSPTQSHGQVRASSNLPRKLPAQHVGATDFIAARRDVPPALTQRQPPTNRSDTQNINITQDQPHQAKPKMIRNVADIPSDISSLNSENIGQCLVLLKLDKHIDTFKEEQIDGCLLMDLDESILQQEFKFSKFESKKLINFIKGWRPNVQQVNINVHSESYL